MLRAIRPSQLEHKFIIFLLPPTAGAMGGLGGLGTVQTPQMKSQVEIFVGNIPVGTTQQGLVDFLNAAMLKVRCCRCMSQQKHQRREHEQPPDVAFLCVCSMEHGRFLCVLRAPGVPFCVADRRLPSLVAARYFLASCESRKERKE